MHEDSENIDKENTYNQSIIFNDNIVNEDVEDEENLPEKTSYIKNDKYSPLLNEKKVNKGPYILGETIGEGNFGKVKIALQLKINEKLAIKIINKNKISKLNDVIRIKKEISILKKVRHKNIIQIYEIMESSNNIYLAMEYCENKDLFEYIIKNKRLSELESCRIFRQLINGVEYIHSQNIIHRDLKPENILLDSNLNIKISDFGLSTFYQKGEYLHTACGTPNYSPPEVLCGQPYDGELSDIWACGVILYTMLTGTLPCAQSNEVIIYNQIMNEQFFFPKFLNNDAIDLLSKILNKNLSQRIKINDIKKHCWFNKINTVLTPGIDIKNNLFAPIDYNILNQMKKIGFNVIECKENLEKMKNNALTTVYYLLLKKYVKEGNESVADLKSEEFLNYMKNIQARKYKNQCNKNNIFTNNILGTKNKNNRKNEANYYHKKKQSHDVKYIILDLQKKSDKSEKSEIIKTSRNTKSHLTKNLVNNNINICTKIKKKKDDPKISNNLKNNINSKKSNNKQKKKIISPKINKSPTLPQLKKLSNVSSFTINNCKINTIYDTKKSLQTKDLFLINSYISKKQNNKINANYLLHSPKQKRILKSPIHIKTDDIQNKNPSITQNKSSYTHFHTNENVHTKNDMMELINENPVCKCLNTDFEKNIYILDKNSTFDLPVNFQFQISNANTANNSNKKNNSPFKKATGLKHLKKNDLFLLEKNDIQFNNNPLYEKITNSSRNKKCKKREIRQIKHKTTNSKATNNSKINKKLVNSQEELNNIHHAHYNSSIIFNYNSSGKTKTKLRKKSLSPTEIYNKRNIIYEVNELNKKIDNKKNNLRGKDVIETIPNNKIIKKTRYLTNQKEEVNNILLSNELIDDSTKKNIKIKINKKNKNDTKSSGGNKLIRKLNVIKTSNKLQINDTVRHLRTDSDKNDTIIKKTKTIKKGNKKLILEFSNNDDKKAHTKHLTYGNISDDNVITVNRTKDSK